MTYTAEIFGSTIVVLGAFNPAIFSADWLEANGLIGRQDADAARHNPAYVVTHQVTALETDWFTVQVLENQLIVASKGALSPTIKDLAVGALSLLPHTPITAVGLNFMGHYNMTTETDYHKIGDVFAPKQIWNELFPAENNSAGLTDLSMRISPVPRGKILETGDQKNISLQPSSKIKFGIYLSYNDHRVVRADEDSNTTAAEITAKIVANGWQSSWQDAIAIFDGLISKALAEQTK